MQLNSISALILYFAIAIGFLFKQQFNDFVASSRNFRSTDLWNHPITTIQSSFLAIASLNSFLLFLLILLPAPVIYWLFQPYSQLYKPLDKLARKKKSGYHVPPVYPNGWFKALASTDLPNKGSITSLRMMGEELVAFRSTTDGKVHIMDAYCKHLGAHLAVGGEVINGDCLRCPFHGWQWNGKTGQCVGIPYEEKPPSSLKTKVYQCFEQNGCVFVWFDAEEREPNYTPPKLEGCSDGTGSYQYHGEIKCEVVCHIQEMMENGADIFHLAELHNTRGFLHKIVAYEWAGDWKVNEENPWQTEMWIRSKFNLFGGLISFHPAAAEIKQIGPGVVHIRLQLPIGGEIVVQETQTPQEPYLQRLELIIHASWWLPRWVVKIGMTLFMINFLEDQPIWNNKIFTAPPQVSKSEGRILKYRRWFSQFYSDNSPTLKSLAMESMTW